MIVTATLSPTIKASQVRVQGDNAQRGTHLPPVTIDSPSQTISLEVFPTNSPHPQTTTIRNKQTKRLPWVLFSSEGLHVKELTLH